MVAWNSGHFCTTLVPKQTVRKVLSALSRKMTRIVIVNFYQQLSSYQSYHFSCDTFLWGFKLLIIFLTVLVYFQLVVEDKFHLSHPEHQHIVHTTLAPNGHGFGPKESTWHIETISSPKTFKSFDTWVCSLDIDHIFNQCEISNSFEFPSESQLII